MAGVLEYRDMPFSPRLADNMDIIKKYTVIPQMSKPEPSRSPARQTPS